MKIKSIDVQASSKKLATDISMLVDNPEFLKEINRLREKWNITSLFSDCDKFSEFSTAKFDKDIDDALKKFKRDKGFKRVVEYALLTGTVPDKVYKRAYFDVVTIGEKEDINQPENYQYVIVMSPRAEKNEVIEAYNEFQEHIRGHEAENEYDQSVQGKINFHNSTHYDMDIPGHAEEIMHFWKGTVYDSADNAKFKTLKQLERTREWYWMRFEDNFNDKNIPLVTYPKVLDMWNNKCEYYKKGEIHPQESECEYCSLKDINTIEQAVSDYIKLLSIS